MVTQQMAAHGTARELRERTRRHRKARGRTAWYCTLYGAARSKEYGSRRMSLAIAVSVPMPCHHTLTCPHLCSPLTAASESVIAVQLPGAVQSYPLLLHLCQIVGSEAPRELDRRIHGRQGRVLLASAVAAPFAAATS